MHRRPSLTRAFTLLAAVALAASAYPSSDADKAGGTRTKPPVVLTLADHEQGPDQVQFWIEEVQPRAGGSLRIQVTNHGAIRSSPSTRPPSPTSRPARPSWPR